MSNSDDRALKGIGYELFVLLTSILSMVNSVLITISAFDGAGGDPAIDVLVVMELALTPVFATDFLYRLLTTRSRTAYFFGGFGWADLLATIPMLRLFRLTRVIFVIRQLRALGGARLAAELDETRAKATFLMTMFLVFLVVEVAGATIYAAESRDPSSNIGSAGDALWWAMVTITTVGYGDYYPVTPEGRVIGVFLLFAGIALFSVLTGFIANFFLAPHRRRWLRRADQAPVSESLATVRALIAEQEERTAAIGRQLDELERAVKASAGDDATRRA